MEERKIYISLKEAEDLIFNRMINLPKSRLTIQKAQGLLSVSICINENNLLENNFELIVLFSAVLKFEVLEKERTLFLSHYKIPEGLLSVSKTREMVRDENRKEQFFANETRYDLKKYVLLRNGCVGLYDLTCVYPENRELSKVICEIFNSILDRNSFVGMILSDLLADGKFPVKLVKVEKFVTDRFYRAVWLLTKVKQNIEELSNDSNIEEVESVKVWLRNLLEIDDIILLKKSIEQAPKILHEDLECILGYYFAATRFEEFQSDRKSRIQFIKTLNVRQEIQLLSWTTFFFSIFDEETPFLYFSPLVQKDIIEIETAIFRHLFFEAQNVGSIQLKFGGEFSTQEKTENYLRLTSGIQNQNIEVIQEAQTKVIFKSNLSSENLSNIGLELPKSNLLEFEGLNTCSFQNHYFQLNINADTNLKEVVFYLEIDSKCDAKLKSLGIKRKTLDKLLPKKKVVVSFVYIDEISRLTELYSPLIAKIKSIEKVVIVCLFNLQPNIIQSIEFDNMFRNYQNHISSKLNVKCDFIIRNENNPDAIEIKRNLKNAIGKYKTAEIELVYENLTTEKMNWVIESSMGYWIEQEGFNYFSFKTLH